MRDRPVDHHDTIEPRLLAGLVVGSTAGPGGQLGADPDGSGPEQPLLLDLTGEPVSGGCAGGGLAAGKPADGHRSAPELGEVAAAIRAAVDAERPLVVLGPAVTVREGDGPPGLFNVLAAVRHALNGAAQDELLAYLASRDATALAAVMTRMSDADAALVRSFVWSWRTADPAGLDRRLADSGPR